jgi:hypothetical protein
MKHLLAILVACLSLAFVAAAQQSDSPDPGPNGKPGVENGTCWKNSSGNQVSVKLSGGIHSVKKVTVTEGKKSGSGDGTPDPDGGVTKSETIKVGKETYKVHGGKMKWKNPAGKWITMTKIKCPDEADTR